jgi:hypothetical protein
MQSPAINRRALHIVVSLYITYSGWRIAKIVSVADRAEQYSS